MMSKLYSDIKITSQKIYQFLITDEWLDVVLGIGLWALSFFFFTLSNIVVCYMFVKAFMLLLGNYLNNKMSSCARVAFNAIKNEDDSFAVNKLTAYAYSTLVAFFLLTIVNIPVFGSLLTAIPCAKTLIFSLIIVAGIPIRSILNIVCLFVLVKSKPYLPIMDFSVAEVIVYNIIPEYYAAYIFEAEIGSDNFSKIIDELISSALFTTQSDDTKKRIVLVKTNFNKTKYLPTLAANIDKVKTLVDDLSSLLILTEKTPWTTKIDNDKQYILTSAIFFLSSICGFEQI